MMGPSRQTVRDLLRDGPVETGKTVSICLGLCRVLAGLHASRRTAGALSPDRVLVDAAGTATLGPAQAPERAYSAPEALLGRPTTSRSDLYSLGVLTYELLTGTHPCPTTSSESISFWHVNTPPEPPSSRVAAGSIPPTLDGLVCGLLGKYPASRPTTSEVEQTLGTLHSAPARQAASRPLATPLIGRGRQLATLHTALEDAIAGYGSTILVAGEPGVGKTRLAEELLHDARRRSAACAVGRCDDDSGTPAYWPWAQVVRQALAGLDVDTSLALLGPAAPTLAQAVPELRTLQPGLPQPPSLGPDQARFRLHVAMADLLRNRASHPTVGRPLVVFLEDVHSADTPSLRMLQFLAHELRNTPIMLLATYRNIGLHRDHPLHQALVEIDRTPNTHHLTLTGLPPAAIAEFVEATTGMTAPARLVGIIHERTDGNPLFVTEVLHLLTAEADLDLAAEHGWGVAVPRGITEAINRHLEQLSERCRDVLTAAAVVGRQFSVELLGEVLDAKRHDVLDLLDEAESVGVVERRHGIGQYAFSHALLREATYGALSSLRRSRCHATVAAALERTYGAHVDDHLDELAHHWFEATPAHSPDKAVEYGERAGREAMARLAYEQATAHFQRALEASSAGHLDDSRHCDLLVALGAAQWCANDLEASRAAFDEAAKLADRIGDTHRFGLAALGYGGPWTDIGRVNDRARVLLEQALERVDPTDELARSRLLGRLAQELYFCETDEWDRRDALSAEAVRIARRVGDPQNLAHTLRSRHLAIWATEQVAERLDIADEIVAIARSAGDVELELHGHHFATVAYLETGQTAAAREAVRRYGEAAAASGQPAHRAVAHFLEGTIAIVTGDFETGRALAARGHALCARYPMPVAVHLGKSQAAAFLWLLGRLEELVRHAERELEDFPDFPTWHIVLALVHTEHGRLDEARALLDRYGANDYVFARDRHWLVSMSGIAELCYTVGDAALAPTLYERLLPFADRFAVIGHGCGTRGSVQHFLALLAATAGEHDVAEGHFEAAIAAEMAADLRPFAAASQRAYAQYLQGRGSEDDTARAAQLFSEAHALAASIDPVFAADRFS